MMEAIMFIAKIIGSGIFLWLYIYMTCNDIEMYPHLKNMIIENEKDEHIREEKIRRLRNRNILSNIRLLLMTVAMIFLLFVCF